MSLSPRRPLFNRLALLGLAALIGTVLWQQMRAPEGTLGAAMAGTPGADELAHANARGADDSAAITVAQVSPGADAADQQAGPGIPLPHWALHYTAQGGAHFSGQVPNAAEREALLQRARSIYGAERVSSALEVASVANPNWLNPAFVPDFRGAEQAEARLADGRLQVQATVPDEAVRARLNQDVAGLSAYGLRVHSRLQLQRHPHPAAPR